MKRWRLNTRAFHNNRIHEPGEIIELEDDVAPPSKAQFIPGKGQAIEDVPMAEEVTEAAPAPVAPTPPVDTPTPDFAAVPPASPPAEVVEPLVPRFDPGELIPSAPEKEVVAEETPPRPL